MSNSFDSDLARYFVVPDLGPNCLLKSSIEDITRKCLGPVHEISNNVVCATSKASDQSAHMRSLIRAFASHLSIL